MIESELVCCIIMLNRSAARPVCLDCSRISYRHVYNFSVANIDSTAPRIHDLDSMAAIRANILFVSLARNVSGLAPAAPANVPLERCTVARTS